MVPNRPCSLPRTTIALVLLGVTSVAHPSVSTPAVQAQELPAGVASELVDRALERQLEAPPAAVAETPRQWAPRALAWSTMALAVILLVTGWARGEFARGGSHREGAARAGPPDDDGPDTRTSSTLQAREKPGPDAPKPALVLPSHVTAVLERAAAKRRAETPAGDGHTDTERAAESAPDAEPAPKSLDFVVPGYDPWKDR